MHAQPASATVHSRTNLAQSRPASALTSLLVSLALHLFPGPAAAQVVVTPLLLSGSAAPAGGNYSGFVNAGFNTSGQTAVFALLSGGSTSEGIFVGTPGALQVAALRGSPAPAGGTYDHVGYGPVLNSAGQVAFVSQLNSPVTGIGVFAGAPGAMQAIALSGTPAPAGGTYNGFNGGGYVALNAAGQVAFYGQLTGGSSTAGIFAGAPGSVQAVALQGSSSPIGGTYAGFGNPVLNNAGQILFSAGLTGGSSASAIFIGTPGSLQTVARSGTAAPAGGNYSGLGSPAVNSAGQVSFFASLTGGSSTGGLFAGAPGALQAVAMLGSAAPGGGTYSSLSPFALSASEKMSFYANLSGSSSTSGVFVGAPGAVQAAALAGSLAPNGNGATYSDFLGGHLLNAAGQVAFLGYLTGPGVTNANFQALYAGSPGGVVEIVRMGDMIDFGNGSGLHTVDRILFGGGIGEDGGGSSLSDSGVLMYRLSFTDGSSGVFTSTIPVPEPSAALLTLAGLLAATRFRKRFANKWTSSAR
jgi:hypothetical protein